MHKGMIRRALQGEEPREEWRGDAGSLMIRPAKLLQHQASYVILVRPKGVADMALEHAKPNEVVDLRPLGSATAVTKTYALIKTDRFEVIRLVVPAGTTIPAHRVPGYLTLYCIEGRIKLGPLGTEISGGDWIYLERDEPHSVVGIEDSSLLLTVFFDDVHS